MDYLRADSARSAAIFAPLPIKSDHWFRALFVAGAFLWLSAAPSMAANYALLIGAAD